MTATTQPGITLDDLIAYMANNGYDGPEEILIRESLIRLKEIAANPDAYAVRNNQGYWVGIWNYRAIAEDVAAKGQPSHGQVVVPVALLLRGKP